MSLLAVVSVLFLSMAFQNCQKGALKMGGSTDLSSSGSIELQNSEDNTADLNPVEEELSSDGNSSYQLTPSMTGSASVSTNCSDSSAKFSSKITNAESDALICLEYTLDMPVGHARYGESYSCDQANKFSAPASDWNFNATTKVWQSYDVYLRNHEIFVPGSYRLAVKNIQGEVKRSAALVIKKANSANCLSDASSNPPRSCSYQWEVYYYDGEKQIFGGVQHTPDPENGQDCAASNLGSSTKDQNTNNWKDGKQSTLKCEATCN